MHAVRVNTKYHVYLTKPKRIEEEDIMELFGDPHVPFSSSTTLQPKPACELHENSTVHGYETDLFSPASGRHILL